MKLSPKRKLKQKAFFSMKLHVFSFYIVERMTKQFERDQIFYLFTNGIKNIWYNEFGLNSEGSTSCWPHICVFVFLYLKERKKYCAHWTMKKRIKTKRQRFYSIDSILNGNSMLFVILMGGASPNVKYFILDIFFLHLI